MVFVREKKVKGKTYYYLVKSVRERGRVRQKNIQYLGSEKPSEDEIRRLKKKGD